MKSGTPDFNGERLTEAPLSRGMTAVDLAQFVGVTPQSISQYEMNKQAH